MLQLYCAASGNLTAAAEAQLAVAQAGLCGAAHAAGQQAGDDAGRAGESLARQMPHLAPIWVDAWDAAGRPKAARQSVAHCCPDAASVVYIETLVAMRQARFDAARIPLKQALQSAPKGWQAPLLLLDAQCALHAGEPQASLSALQKAQDLDARRVAIRIAAAKAYLALDRPADAVASLQPVLTPATDAPDVHELMQARTLVAMAIETGAGPISAPERTAVHNLLAMAQDAHVDSKSVEMALSLAEAVPRPRVQTAAALIALKGRTPQAGRRLLLEASTQAPLDPDPPRLLALYDVAHGGPTAALPCLILAARRDPFNTETQTLVADLSQRTGALEQAQHSLQALMRLEPEQPRHKASWQKLAQQRTTPSSDAHPLEVPPR